MTRISHSSRLKVSIKFLFPAILTSSRQLFRFPEKKNELIETDTDVNVSSIDPVTMTKEKGGIDQLSATRPMATCFGEIIKNESFDRETDLPPESYSNKLKKDNRIVENYFRK